MSPKRPENGLVLDPSLGVDRLTGAEQAPADGLVAPEPPEERVVHVLDHLAGMYFWWDEAPPSKKGFYHGHIAVALEGGYYLLEFAPSDKLPAGLHEIVHVALMAEQTWSFYRTEAEYLAALAGGTDDS
jgi:hypothetical protein